MAGPGLPTNIDATYGDDSTDDSIKLHQKSHDVIHSMLNRIDTGFVAVPAVLVYSAGAYPDRPPAALVPAGWATYKGPVQPTTWLVNDEWVNNTPF
jgi:hypothetical protein